MPKYVIDTNLYIRATREDVANRQLQDFFRRAAPWCYLHSVVAQELLAGAISRGLASSTQARFLAPFERVGRVITPTHAAYRRAGNIIAKLTERKRLSREGFRRSFPNDCLLAATAREVGFTLITDNQSDFELIQEVEPFEWITPWPQS